MNKKVIELGKKLKELAERGIGGEKVNAERMLTDLLLKHNLTIEQLEEDELRQFAFNITESEWELWHQIVKNVDYTIRIFGEFPPDVIVEHDLKGNWMIECPYVTYIEIVAKWEFFKRLFKQEYEIFFGAFIHANNLWVDHPNPKDDDSEKLDLYKSARILKMAQGIKKGNFNKQIANDGKGDL